MREHLARFDRRVGAGAERAVGEIELLRDRRRLRATHRGAVAADERVAQDAEEIAEVVVVPQQPRLGEHARIRLLDEIFGVLAAPAQGPGGSV